MSIKYLRSGVDREDEDDVDGLDEKECEVTKKIAKRKTKMAGKAVNKIYGKGKAT